MKGAIQITPIIITIIIFKIQPNTDTEDTKYIIFSFSCTTCCYIMLILLQRNSSPSVYKHKTSLLLNDYPFINALTTFNNVMTLYSQ